VNDPRAATPSHASARNTSARSATASGAPASSTAASSASASATVEATLPGALRVGIINIMPRAESYETYLRRPLVAASVPVDPVWIRLESHIYSSSDLERVRSRYQTFDAARAQAPLDALILTGAPVEELAFEDVRYFSELRAILEHSRERAVPTLGLCWGGLALGHLLGVPKALFEKKLFGVFEQSWLEPTHPLARGSQPHFPCTHSRHSGVLDVELERARDAGLVRLLAHGADTGYTLFESHDRLFLAHLGHPEYPARRLLEEYERDTSAGRAGVEAPLNYDLTHPQATWTPHSDRLFDNWLATISTARQPALAAGP
jgi:homoserine O-succinyltransferase/O-acetyltransferase